MKCPKCEHIFERGKDKILETRQTGDGKAVKRKRKCSACGKSWWTIETTEYMTKTILQ